MPKHIGIVACSAEGASLCYRTVSAQGALQAGEEQPEVSLHAQPLTEYVRHLERGDWESVGELMLDSARKLAAGGADFLIAPDNTIHEALPYIEPRLPLPWLHIADAVVAEAQQRGFRRLGLTGTRWTVESTFYPKKLAAAGIEWCLPSGSERLECNRIIMDEWVRGIFRPGSTAYFQNVIASLKEDRCDAVILGCTEIPLVIDDSNSPLPVLDSTRLLAHAALRRQ